MEIQTKAYGPVEIDERQTLYFSHGLLGFEEYHSYALIDSRQPPFFILQSLDEREIAFVVLSPEVFRNDFSLDLATGDLDDLEWGDDEELLVLAIVTIPRDGRPMTANLQGPLVMNRKKKLGKQVIQVGGPWKTRHNILEEMSKMGAEEC
ncbi:MAG: flagellar assembly protein FliW [Spirochaetales bacterium]|nr:flagellar assembly protein FliW [Spirochaetales bacterium]